MAWIDDAEQDAERKRQRALLLEHVANGALSPADGEAEAERQKLGPLCPKPSPKTYDPMQMPRWSLFMAWTWVSFRSIPPVRSSYNPYYVRNFKWEPTMVAGQRGFVLAPNAPRALHEVNLNAWDDVFATWPGATTLAAVHELFMSLARGEVHSAGRDLRGSHLADLAEIPRDNWLVLQVGCIPEGFPGMGGDMLHFGNKEPVYVDVFIDRETLMAAFPPRVEDDQGDRATEVLNASGITPDARKAEAECASWLADAYMSRCDERTDTKEDLWPSVKSAWPRLSYRAFERAWSEAIRQADAPRWAEGGTDRPGAAKLNRQGERPLPPSNTPPTLGD